MPNIEIITEGIIQLLNTIDPFKATGPDGLPLKLLMELSYGLAPCLTLLFKASLHQSTLPEDWKTALVTPLFNKGGISTSDPNNYRPISLTVFAAKYLSILFTLTSCHIWQIIMYSLTANLDFVQSAQLSNNYFTPFMTLH